MWTDFDRLRAITDPSGQLRRWYDLADNTSRPVAGSSLDLLVKTDYHGYKCDQLIGALVRLGAIRPVAHQPSEAQRRNGQARSISSWTYAVCGPWPAPGAAYGDSPYLVEENGAWRVAMECDMAESVGQVADVIIKLQAREVDNVEIRVAKRRPWSVEDFEKTKVFHLGQGDR